MTLEAYSEDVWRLILKGFMLCMVFRRSLWLLTIYRIRNVSFVGHPDKLSWTSEREIRVYPLVVVLFPSVRYFVKLKVD